RRHPGSPGGAHHHRHRRPDVPDRGAVQRRPATGDRPRGVVRGDRAGRHDHRARRADPVPHPSAGGRRSDVRSTRGAGTVFDMTVDDLLDRLGDYIVEDDDDDDPVLLAKDGGPVDTWREGYPYGERMPREEYDRVKRLLQIELLKLQYWIKDSGERLVVLFE